MTTTSASTTVTDTAPAAPVAVAPVVVAVNPVATNVVTTKSPRFIIYNDKNGVELGRKPMTVGRPPKDSVVDSAGNRIVNNCEKLADGSIAIPRVAPVANKTSHYLIYKDAAGNEIHREVLKPGRPGKDWVKLADGNFVKTLGQTVTAAAPAPVAAPVTDAAPSTDAAPAASLGEAIEAPAADAPDADGDMPFTP